ncbi:glycine oxidase ThiO [Solwaraspora sp. WMMD937]|uniref:glycine oxidase ThiO n=1 Tax=Solwaraspora sp. WMMD937 TaxID=3016090 RepID=UPI00249B8E8E|nr:glycine oxidase ThiO [Solwaraspora sp. WMMD937]WFE23383.1 glycine oxidase ThiO [Solwaraspora sp. WMMD937]
MTVTGSGNANGRADVAVVGGGPIGMSIAWRCAQRGLRTALYDPAPGSGASSVAAGMLAPVAESHFGEAELTRLLVDSAARWPAFAAELTAVTGQDIGYRTDGTLVVTLTGDDRREAERLWAYQQSLDLPITLLRATALREREPALAPRVRGGALMPDDHQVDPRRLVAALDTALDRAGVTVVPQPVTDLSALDARVVVVAAGCGSAALTGLPVRPVKGQILRLRAPAGAVGFRHVIRGYADGRHVYLVPRADGEVVVGATVEERVDTTVTAGAVLELLRAAADLLPEIAEYELVEAQAAARPGTPDNAPLLGWHQQPDVNSAGGTAGREVLVATGHHRHGIVLAPVTADLIADLAAGGDPDPALAPFQPARFTAATSEIAREEQPWS